MEVYMRGLATKDEVAAYLQVRPKTLDVWVSRGAGPPYIKIEGVRRYDWAEVEAWVEARKVRH
jgi:predicted DNA-binding transcriptional regulator AlpA